jgi:hypothetical protein
MKCIVCEILLMPRNVRCTLIFCYKQNGGKGVSILDSLVFLSVICFHSRMLVSVNESPFIQCVTG